jgi:TatD DNase family protein
MYFDIHSHHLSNQADIVQIMNVMPYCIIEGDQLGYFSCGMHPWYIGNDLNISQLEQWLDECRKPNLVAIGECGLDKLRGPDIKIQEEIFWLHVKISEELRKPIIIHCVKALNEIIQYRKKMQPQQPWILHGFNGNVQTIEQCVKLGFYFSLNRNCLKKRDLSSWLSAIPFNRLFLESDDSVDVLKELYEQISGALDISESELKDVIAQNIKTVFSSISC